MRLRQIRFDGKNGESHFGCQELEQPILELKELARAVGRFAERDDPCVADDSLEQLEIGEPVARFNRLQPNRSRANPLGHCRFLPRLCREDNDSDHEEKTDESFAHTSQSPGKLANRILHPHPRWLRKNPKGLTFYRTRGTTADVVGVR